MMLALIILPWALTLIALLVVLWKGGLHDHNEEYGDEFEGYGEHETIHVAVYDEKAYWVHENVFYESDVIREPDFTTARPIDTMDLPSKELNKLLSILDELEQSNNERD